MQMHIKSQLPRTPDYNLHKKMKTNIQFLLLILLWPDISAIHRKFRPPYVKSPLGGVEGFYKTSEQGRRFAAFEGVPYAQPPVGDLRFEPPVPISPWIGDIKAVAFSPACPQNNEFHFAISEDCLYLNIYVPDIQIKTPLPVIFWIFGGGYTLGSGQLYGPKYLMDRDVILITFNYRVGPLGFLSTEDNVVPGNMGLKDQVSALKWVSKYIEYFGGDRKRITLMGVSAGGASVHYHYLSPQSRGLFRNGISFSGSAMNPWAFNNRNPLETAKSFAAALDCPEDNSFRMIQCLKRISVENMLDTMRKLYSQSYISQFPFVPVAEKTSTNYFINDTPKNIMEKGNVYDAPWIIGAVAEEGLFMTASFILNKTLVKYTDENWEKVGPALLFLNNVNMPLNEQPALVKKAKEHYFHGESITSDLTSTRKLTHLVGDAIITIGNIRAAKLQAKVNKSPVRFYYYTYRAAQSTSDTWSHSKVNLGVCHDDDIYLVLENLYIDPTTTNEDKAMLHDMLNFWYSFANEGSPDLGRPWKPLNSSAEFRYMHIAGPNNFSMESNDNLGDILFWDKI